MIDVTWGLFFLLFTYTAFSKIVAFNTFLYDLERDPKIGVIAQPIAILVPLIELIISYLLASTKYRQKGFIASAILMTIFTGYVFYVLNFDKENAHCTCGGFIREMSWTQHLWFNIALTLIAIAGYLIDLKLYNLNRSTTTSYTK